MIKNEVIANGFQHATKKKKKKKNLTSRQRPAHAIASKRELQENRQRKKYMKKKTLSKIKWRDESNRMENEQGIIPKNTDKKVKNEMNKFKIKWREKK